MIEIQLGVSEIVIFVKGHVRLLLLCSCSCFFFFLGWGGGGGGGGGCVLFKSLFGGVI